MYLLFAFCHGKFTVCLPLTAVNLLLDLLRLQWSKMAVMANTAVNSKLITVNHWKP